MAKRLLCFQFGNLRILEDTQDESTLTWKVRILNSKKTVGMIPL